MSISTCLTLLIILCLPCVHAEEATITLKQLADKQPLIQEVAKQFDINPLYLTAIIYTERTLNYDQTDIQGDIPLAILGYNSSIGFCQIKLKTAYFIEKSLNDRNSAFYAGEKYEKILTVSQNPNELINHLNDDKHNIQYAAAYLRIMQSRWAKTGFPIDSRLDILGTLYSTGLFHNDGSERLPNSQPIANEFGKKTLAFYCSNVL